MVKKAIPAPSTSDILEISRTLGLGISEDDAHHYQEVVTGSLTAYDRVAEITEAAGVEPVKEREYRVPSREENPNNAWHVKSAIQEITTGKLAGKRVAIKDSIPVAGLPMVSGSNIFAGYVPEFDAEVVKRILAEGGVIAGKAHCEYLCFSGSSHTSVGGRIENPWGKGRSTGGSSSGSAALVASGEVDFALGADQAGSIRMPASFSGIVGLKPTYGLVPYTGIAPLDNAFDHVGPMTATVADAALLLNVLAGPDGIDARQHGQPAQDYVSLMTQGVKGLRIGVLKEAFEVAGTQSGVVERVNQAAEVLRKLGATVETLSVPDHLNGFDIWTTIGWTGMTETVLKGNGFGISKSDFYPTSMMAWARENVRGIEHAPASVKLFFVISEYAKRHLGFVGYGNGINAARLLRRQYDACLKNYDLLLMPTTPMTALGLPDAATTLEQELKTSHPMALNTAPFNITHHPAMSLPCGGVESLPVGLMLVAKHYDEASIFRAAWAYEQTGEGRYR